MTNKNIKKITVLCECDDGRYIAGSTDNAAFIRIAVDYIQFVEVKPECVGTIDASEIMHKEQKKENKLF